jgi:putative protease
MEIDEDQYGTYLMNSRDLCAIDYIKELKDAGIISFKVE